MAMIDDEEKNSTQAIPLPENQAGQRMAVTKPRPGVAPGTSKPVTTGARRIDTGNGPVLTNVDNPGRAISEAGANGMVNGRTIDKSYLDGLNSRRRTGTLANGDRYTYFDDAQSGPASANTGIPTPGGDHGYTPWFMEQSAVGPHEGGPNLAVGHANALRDSFTRIKAMYPGINDGQAASMAEDEYNKTRRGGSVADWEKSAAIRRDNAASVQSSIRGQLESDILDWAKREDPRLAAMILMGFNGKKSAIPGTSEAKPNWDVIKQPRYDEDGYPIDGAYDYFRYNQTSPNFEALPVFPGQTQAPAASAVPMPSMQAPGQGVPMPTYAEQAPTVPMPSYQPPAPVASTRQPPPAAISALMADPSLREQFVAKYGTQYLPAGV